MSEISKTESRIAWRYWSKKFPVFYVSHLPKDGSDYGYTDKRKGVKRGNETLDAAIELTPYWQRRFKANCERMGVEARFQKP